MIFRIFCRRGRGGRLLVLLAWIVGANAAGAASYKVYSTYLWHLQQPIYWPEKVSYLNRYQFAHESLSGSPTWPGHPQNNLSDIFGLDDRKAAYQFRTRDSVATMSSQPDAGAQLSYAASLIENVWSLGDNNELGYGPTWYAPIREAMGWTTTRGKHKLEPVGFSYHHAFMPLIDADARRKEIAINKEIWWKAWNGNPDKSDHPKGFRCSEEAFSERVIPQLVEAGYEWVIVPNHHLSRTHPNYVQLHGKGVYDPPNKADQNNPPNSGGWYSGEIDGRGSTESLPFSFQPHRAKYVNPETGAETNIIVVPMTDLGSYRDGYSSQGIDILNMLNGYATYDRPCIALFSHDGDNAWGGGFSYYQEAVPSFVNSAGYSYRPTTIQTFLDEAAPPASDIVHVEDGAWMNAENDWGTPLYANWLWPPQRDRNSPAYNSQNPATYADITNGWAEDFRNWAVVMAAQNFVSTAEQITRTNGGSVADWRIQEPVQRNGTDNGANNAELAWHFFLAALDSGYMYYGASIDMEVKPTLACNKAIEYAQLVISGQTNKDYTGPTVFNPQRYPWNPGSTNYGAHLGYKVWVAPSDFHVWTFAYDVSTITSVVLKTRADLDGYNPLDNNDNETYAGGASVGAWQSYAMNLRPGASFASNLFNDPNINFFMMPSRIADEYWYYVTGYNNQLVDYYIEAYDGRGNVRRTDIQHVFVGSQGGGTPVIFTPSAPRSCEPLAVAYNSVGRPLSNASPVAIEISYDNWGSSNACAMAGSLGATWRYTNAFAAGTPKVRFRGSGTLDDNAGASWSVTISACASNTPSSVGFNPPAPDGCGSVEVIYSPNNGPLQDAANVHIHAGHNGWQGVPPTDPLMTKSGTNWTYTYSPPDGTYQIDCVFNNGAGVWDNHGEQDWSVTVSNCVNPVAFSPADPEDCDDLVVEYDSAGRPLSGANPVHMVINHSGHFSLTSTQVMSGVLGGTWLATNAIPGGSKLASVHFQNADGTTDDGMADPWSVLVWACSAVPLTSSVAFNPPAPSGCDDVQVIYFPGTGPLKDATNIYIHIGHNGWRDVITPDPAMAKSGTNWVYTYASSPGTEEINVALNDGRGTWDNYGGNDWAVAVSNCSQIVTQILYFAEGSPEVTGDPEPAQNYVGDNFDLNRSGGAAVTTDQGGFGSFGSLYLNYDDTNLYIGATGVNIGGNNNSMIIFLELNTLNDDKNSLWGQTGLPQGLDNLHNLWIEPRADLAIVLGDEYGDGQYPNFNLGDGYDFGQGIWYLSAASFVDVAGAKLSQFDGTGTNATTSADDDGDRLTDRWEASIPWTSLNAPEGIGSITSCYVCGVVCNSGTNGADRYLSGNYLGLTATNDGPRDAWNNFAFTFVTLTALEIGIQNRDSDGDGMPDDWESRFFGGATNATCDEDFDGDGFSNCDEFRLGTHPKNAASLLALDSVFQSANYPGITWQSVGGKSYRVDYSDDLTRPGTAFSNITLVIESDVDDGVESIETFTDSLLPAPAHGFRFYRVRLAP